MEIEFAVAGDSNYAMNPQTEKRTGPRVMRMSHRGCTHFLVFSSPLNVQIDFDNPEFRKQLVSISDRLVDANITPLPGMEDITITCVSHMAFRKANEYIELPDKAANYAVCGCFLSRDNASLRIFVPAAGMRYRVSVAVELHYKMKPYVKITKKFLREERERTPFYEVCFEKKNSFIDGSVIYTIGRMPYQFAITEQMLGKSFLIRTDGELPKFESLTPGVILCND